MRVSCLIVATSVAASRLLFAQVSPTGSPHIVSVCQVLAEPLQYDGKLITLRGTMRGTDEGTWFFGEDCPGVLVTDGHIWPSEISVDFPYPGSPTQLHQVDFQFDFQSERRTSAKYRKVARRAPENCVLFTYTGLFETRRDWSRYKFTNRDGKIQYSGFGHLSGVPGQLITKSHDDVSVIPGCRTNRPGKIGTVIRKNSTAH